MATIVLNANTQSIKIAMTSAAATTNPDWLVAYADNTGNVFTEGTNDGVLSGNSYVTVVLGVNSTRRVVKSIVVHNRDTQANTILVKYDSGTQRRLYSVTLAVGDTWTLDGTYDSSGALRQTTPSFDSISPITTKGDLITSNGTADVRLPVGTNDYVLTADSTQATGLKWASATTTGKAIAMSLVFGF